MSAAVPPAESFPYAAYRPGQREALEAARAAFARGKRFVIIEAPTGAGKSGIAVALAREAKSAYILTAQKLLQAQYVRDFPDLAQVKGRANYPCLHQNTHAGAAPCMAGRKFNECEDCEYLLAKHAAMEAHTATLNYPYFLGETNYSGGFGRRDLLILDEAHNTEEMVMRFVEVTVSSELLARYGISASLPAGLNLAERMEAASDLIPSFADALRRLDNDLARQDPIPPDQAVARADLEGLVTRLHLLADADPSEWVGEEAAPSLYSDTAEWRFRPIRVSNLAPPFLFAYADRVLFLSATILDPQTFLRSLGVPQEQATFIRVPSSFPKENRPIHPLSVAHLSRDSLLRELPRLAEAVSRLLDRHPEKGIIHAHSYQILRYLLEALPERHQGRLIAHTSAAGREDALRRHLESDDGTVLITPSMTEGVDLADDQARWQVIVKVPYPYLGDAQVAARRAADPQWYEWRTALRLVQAYGRAVRSPTDRAVTYVLDAQFGGWVRRQGDRLPGWFREAIAPAPADL
ncbi:MAG TPA: helicase C-terminal domain-containing protein [Deinococcales bacterium]|nr:helicase C-terminal domain-containing protein [Deinococcales bacterium]